MYFKVPSIAVLFLCAQCEINAQSISTLIGARANALAYGSSCLQDEWSLFNNVAGLANIEQLSFNATYDWRPALPVGNRMAAGVSVPTSLGVAGIGFFRFGDDLYNEQLLSFGFANQFGLASLGMKVNYIQYNAEGFGRKGLVSVSLGGIAELTSTLKIGAHIINLNQAKLSSAEGERIPTKLILGMAFIPTEKVFVTAEVEKDIEYKPTWKAALEYTPFKKAAFRTGFNIQPNAAFFGAGFIAKRMKIDYALQYSVVIGASHQASVTYQLQ